MSDRPFFSVVIPALNEEKYLPHLLADLAEQTFKHFEVIVVDGNSEDKTVAVAKTYADILHLTICTVDKRNVSYQRNYGAKQAQAEWVIFADADTRIPPYFLEGITYQLAKHPKVSVFTTLLTTDEEQPMDRAVETLLNLGLGLYNSFNRPSAFGALLGAKKKVATEIGFDEHQKVLEDSFFVRATIAAGYTFEVFTEPRYVFSLRRVRKEGTLKMLATTAKMQLKTLGSDGDIPTDMGYTMAGGGYYDKAKPTLLQEVQDFLEKASKSQLDQAKRFLTKLR
jgi:glycosyltransferase involved in cell wall biosynthesis